MSNHLDGLDRVIAEVAAPAATSTDDLGLFPLPDTRVMAPTTDALLDFVGRAASGLPLVRPV